MEETCQCKVGRVIADYDLTDADPQHETIDEGLVARWKGTNGHSKKGYRSLNGWFNRQLLKRIYAKHGRESLGARIKHDYEALSGDDELIREEVLEDLRSDGIDAERIADDLVSWGTLRTHLQQCLDETKPSPESDSDWQSDTVAMAESFAKEKAKGALSSLENTGTISDAASASVEVQIELSCEHCPTRVPFDVALDRGYVCDNHRKSSETTGVIR